MRSLTLPPLVLLLLLVFLWLILLVLLLWFALRPHRLEAPHTTTHETTQTPKNTSEARKKTASPEDEVSSPVRRTVIVRKVPAKPEDEARDDAFDGYNRPNDRRDDFDF